MAKTIYEMAVDYATEDGEGGKPIVIKCEKDAAIFGANYVLEQLEEFQKLFSTCMNAHANGYLKSVIEQLKK